MKKKIGIVLLFLMITLAMTISAFGATKYIVSGTKNYLALRNAPATSTSNEIGKLFNGEVFNVTEITSNNFAYGYTNANQYGYVNAKYLVKGSSKSTKASGLTSNMYGTYYFDGYNNPDVSESQRKKEAKSYYGTYVEVIDTGNPNSPLFKFGPNGMEARGFVLSETIPFTSHGVTEYVFTWGSYGDAGEYYSIYSNGHVVMHSLCDNSEVIYKK